MKPMLILLMFFVPSCSIAQTITVSGRCFYDVNGNHVFDAPDSVLANRTIGATHAGGVYSSLTNASGLYTMNLAPGSYDFYSYGSFDGNNYKNLGSIQRTYTTGGADVVDLAYQQRDSIEYTSCFINADNPDDLPETGGIRSFNMQFYYSGLIPNLPVTIQLKFNPTVHYASSSIAPSVSAPGLLKWNLPAMNRTTNNNNNIYSIDLSLSFPATGDTIGYFVVEPDFIPGIMPAKAYSKIQYPANLRIEHPFPEPTGVTRGIKWLRHFEALTTDSYDEGISVDTSADGKDYLVAGIRSPAGYDAATYSYPVYVAKLNSEGLTIWEKYLDTLQGTHQATDVNAIRHTADGGCYVLGYANSIEYNSAAPYSLFIIKFDNAGNITWTKILKASRFIEAGGSIALMPDGGGMITGSTSAHDFDFANNHPDTTYSNLFVTRFAADGQVIFTKVYGGSREDLGYRLGELNNGSFLLLGTTSSEDGDVTGAHHHNLSYEYYGDSSWYQEAWVININADGDIIWDKCYGGSNSSIFGGFAETGSGIILTGATDSKNGDLPYYPENVVPLWVVNISPTGTIQSSRLHKLYVGYQDSNYIKFPDEIYDNYLFSRLHKTKDGNFILGGVIADKYGEIKTRHGYSDIAVVKINVAGDILWQKAIGGSQYEWFSDIQLDKNDDIIFIGSSFSDDDDLYQHPPNGGPLMVVGKLGITNTIKGHVYLDLNGNHTMDAGETFYSEGKVSSIKNTDTLTARIFNGEFLVNADTGTYVTTYTAPNNYFNVYPASHNFSFTGFDLEDNVDFALTPIPGKNDLEIQVIPLLTPRPGFDVTYRLITKNAGTTNLTNTVIGFKYDSRMVFQDASRNKSGSATDSLWWGPFTLNAFKKDTLYVNFKLKAPPVLNNGDTITNTARAYPVVSDLSPQNNVTVLREVVRGSFDPNDKTESHGGTLTTTQYANGEFLQYMIRFQNTGTDTAFYITIKDTLRQNLDLASLEIIAASHPFSFTLHENVAIWDFKKINLPDSTTDETASHGFIQFRVKPKPDLAVGEIFANKAAIYFDYNLPVITNQDKTTIGSNNGVCPGGNVSFAAGITGSSYQWQINSGSGYTNLSNGGMYAGVNTPVLSLSAVPASMNRYRYRCLVNGVTTSPENILKFAVHWTGNAGNAWNNAANWDCGKIPDANTEVYIPESANDPYISTGAACYSLTLATGVTVTVQNGVSLNITGKIE